MKLNEEKRMTLLLRAKALGLTRLFELPATDTPERNFHQFDDWITTGMPGLELVPLPDPAYVGPLHVLALAGNRPHFGRVMRTFHKLEDSEDPSYYTKENIKWTSDKDEAGLPQDPNAPHHFTLFF
ncbi:hypothetical protein V5O48_017870, partial [Marasmius crinis-equi]